MADTKQIDWGDGSGEKITVTASSFVGNKGIQIQSPENVKVIPRSKTIVLKSVTDPTKVARINVTQEKAVYTYDFTLSASASMIGAEGGTSRVRGTLVTYRNGVQVSSETVVPTLSGSADGFSISGDVVTAANRGTTVGLVRRITVTGTYSDTFDGQEVSATVVISQAANAVTRVKISTGDGDSPITSFSAAGRSNWWYYAYGTYASGSSARIPDSYSGWSLESVSWASIAPAAGATYAASFSCDSRGSEVGDVRTVELSFTYNGKSDSITISQAANSATALEIREIGDKDLKLNISAAGMYNYWCQLYATYTSGARSVVPMSDIEWSSSNSAILSIRTLGSTYVAIDVLTRGTEVGAVRTADLIAKYSGLETSVAFTQAKNEATTITYGDINITNYSYSDIPASGGNSSPILAYVQSATQNYSSGATSALSDVTSGATLVYSKVGTDGGGTINTTSGVVSAGTRGVVEGPRWELGVFKVQVSLNGKTSSNTVICYQAENKIESYNYGAWNIAISANPMNIGYGGGNSTITASCTRSKTPVYSSGAVGSAGSESAMPTLSGSATGFILSGTTVTASANSWAATRSITVTASYSGATSKSVTITQAAAPASISLNKTTIAFPQRASSNTVQLTCNSDWDVNSNAEFAIPETLQIKYNPSTDVVELVDQPVQIIKKVQESSDYALAFIRIGSPQEPYSHTPTKAISRRDIVSAKNSGGFVTKMNEWLISQSQNKTYHRIVARNWFYNGNATQQIQAGTEVLRNPGMASLMPSDTLISKPGKALGLRNVGLVIPKSLRFLLAEEWKFYKLTSLNANIEVDVNNKTGRIKFTVSEFSNVADSRARSPKESFMRCQSQIGPVGYILYKKASTTEYLDVRGWKEVSNFALARSLSDNEIKVKSSGGVEIVVMKFKYGED